ncbi:hypothetical protein AAVH_30927 [Aphelenchoides avenae]|nr:hypothetical protein AAVH_30927 [Aphelenchus avenae]
MQITYLSCLNIHSTPLFLHLGVQIPEFAPVTATKSHGMSYFDRATADRSTLFLRRLKFLSERGELPPRFQHTTKDLADTTMGA